MKLSKAFALACTVAANLASAVVIEDEVSANSALAETDTCPCGTLAGCGPFELAETDAEKK